jgi:hypothetical protein
MTTEQLIAKGVKHHFNGQESVFELESLNEHFEGLQIHETDIFELIIPVLLPYEDFISVNFVKESDVDFSHSTAKEVAPKVEEIEHVVTAETLADNPELVVEGIEAGETITVDEVEPIAETPAPKKKRVTKPKQK